jgi:hypothetical protein
VAQKYSELLEKSLDAARWTLLRLVAEEATRGGLPLYIVGGSVRDLVLGRRSMTISLWRTIALRRQNMGQGDCP